MPDFSAILGLISSATSSLLGATQIGQNLKQTFSSPKPDIVETKLLVVELLERLLKAYAAQMEIQQRIVELQAELEQRDAFAKDLARYELMDAGRGTAIYRLKPHDRSGEPAHGICPTCVANRKKSVLQPAPENLNFWGCFICGARFLRDNPQGSGIIVGPTRRSIFDID